MESFIKTVKLVLEVSMTPTCAKRKKKMQQLYISINMTKCITSVCYFKDFFYLHVQLLLEFNFVSLLRKNIKHEL